MLYPDSGTILTHSYFNVNAGGPLQLIFFFSISIRPGFFYYPTTPETALHAPLPTLAVLLGPIQSLHASFSDI